MATTSIRGRPIGVCLEVSERAVTGHQIVATDGSNKRMEFNREQRRTQEDIYSNVGTLDPISLDGYNKERLARTGQQLKLAVSKFLRMLKPSVPLCITSLQRR
ncbi:uncharacterized protein LOC134225617 [Armigeres subalbatus]|uniref:uncharacterized protein LOC134225617 n=1 Tax=Armigeres subalbatus TaxID=124917 RepID=UPI002ED2CAB3